MLFESNNFAYRHIGPRASDGAEMLKSIGCDSLDDLVCQTIPNNILLNRKFKIKSSGSEFDFLQYIQNKSQKNKLYKSYIGLGYYDTITPGVILRNIFENPGWYTQYTPYQSEISQGRLEALLNFQTMVTDLTSMDISNASLLDEATAAAEGMTMLARLRSNKEIKDGKYHFFVSEGCFPQTIEVLKTRAEPLGIDIVVGNHRMQRLDEKYFGLLVQYPDQYGQITDYTEDITECRESGIKVIVCADLLSITLIKPPGEMGADVVCGTTQRFGVPMGYGGPHAAYFATRDEFKRQIPGRLIGVSIDAHGRNACRMAIQTREQHIRRDKATSNICTAQSLPAILASMYAVYHGPGGLKKISEGIHAKTMMLNDGLQKMGLSQKNELFFDTLRVDMETNTRLRKLQELTSRKKINLRYIKDSTVGISVDETKSEQDIIVLLDLFSKVINNKSEIQFNNLIRQNSHNIFPDSISRNSKYLSHQVFNTNHSETKMLRYIKKLENMDLSLNTSMIPLGSCTMKLNATSGMIPITWEKFSRLHPFAPLDQCKGYLEIFKELEKYLSIITGFPGVSLQPNSGAQGEYAGLMVIRQYHKSMDQSQREVVLVPSSAHGTNPASAAMCGMDIVVIECDKHGNIDINDLEKKASEHKDRLSALMITYPSTHGVFEDKIVEICNMIHKYGGQIYMDGANMNAQVGLTSPSKIGADICHLNLHKTFSIPHGGGGPGMGPICAAEHLVPYLPGHCIVPVGGEKAIGAVSSAPWGSGSILVISYAFIKMLGGDGITLSTKYAILNANYLKTRLEQYFKILYSAKNGRVAHEFIIDLREFKKTADVEVEDIAKRLMDYGFHAPTISWPVAGTMMIEPTESEPKEELDRFCDALISIFNEIKEIEDGVYDRTDNVLKNAPHTALEVCSDDWSHTYSRLKAAYPVKDLKYNKFWPAVGRVNNPYGDKNLVCTCLPVEDFT